MTNRLLAVGFALAFGSAAASEGLAQGQALLWGEDTAPAEDRNGATLATGATVQLLAWDDVNGVPTFPPPIDFTDPEGVQPMWTVVAVTEVQAGGNIFNSVGNIESAGFDEDDFIFARVFELPSSGGAGSSDLPDPSGDGGLWFADQELVVPATDLGNPGDISFSYQFSVDENDWTFQAIPEPGTIVLAGLGFVVLLVRRRFKNR